MFLLRGLNICLSSSPLATAAAAAGYIATFPHPQSLTVHSSLLLPEQGGDDPDLARALAASLADRDDFGAGGSSQGAWRSGAGAGAGAPQDDEDADLAAAIAASLAEHRQDGQQGERRGPSDQAGAAAGPSGGRAINKMDLAAAIEASLQQQQQQHAQHAPAAVTDGAADEPAPASAIAQPALPELGM
jgi:hypothetical protein